MAFTGNESNLFEQVINWLKEESIVFEVCPVVFKCSKEEKEVLSKMDEIRNELNEA